MADIALMGGMGAGKTTVADYLVEHYGYTAKKISTPIYGIAEQLWGPEAAKDRGKLQELGIKMREIDEDVWLNLYLEDVTKAREEGLDIVNDTLRMRNEYWALKELGFKFIRILTREATRQDRLMKIGRIQDSSELQHATETDLIGLEAAKEGIGADYTITNDGDLELLYAQIQGVMLNIEGES